jgi:hypothetical protein
MERWIEVTAATSPTLAISAHAFGAVPLPLAVIGAVAGPSIYICRQVMIGVLGWKALDKTRGNRVAELMSAITGHPFPLPRDGGQPRPAQRRPVRNRTP